MDFQPKKVPDAYYFSLLIFVLMMLKKAHILKRNYEKPLYSGLNSDLS